MKLSILQVVFFLVTSFVCAAQDTLVLQNIDSIVNLNESRIVTVLQKTVQNKLIASHGKNPEKISVTYRFANNDSLISYTHCAYSPGDTLIIVNLYFKEGKLTKALTRDFDMNNKSTDYPYYFENGQLINKEMDSVGIHKGSYYTALATQISKRLKKKPFRYL